MTESTDPQAGPATSAVDPDELRANETDAG